MQNAHRIYEFYKHMPDYACMVPDLRKRIEICRHLRQMSLLFLMGLKVNTCDCGGLYDISDNGSVYMYLEKAKKHDREIDLPDMAYELLEAIKMGEIDDDNFEINPILQWHCPRCGDTKLAGNLFNVLNLKRVLNA